LSAQPNFSSFNTGPVQGSFVGVPAPEVEDPEPGFDALAALTGKDDQTLIRTGSA